MPKELHKTALLKAIVARLTAELEVYYKAARAAHAEATHEQSRAENKYDTRGLEASYLARGQSRQAAEIEASIEEFRTMSPRAFSAGDGIDVGAYVELSGKRERSCYFMGKRAGGTEVTVDGREVLVITPQSPLGAQLIGKKQGERIQLRIGPTQDEYKVAAVR